MSLNGSAGSELAGILRDNYGFLIGGGGGRGPTAPQLQDGAGPVMKPEMGMWLATAAGNNGPSHCTAFFPPRFSTQVFLQIIFFWGGGGDIRQKETRDSMYQICTWLYFLVCVLHIRV